MTPDQGPHIVVFDLETQRSAAEVGGWNKSHLMGMSVGVVWDSRSQDCTTYFEEDIDRLLEHLQAADLVIGFNIIGFDYSVLRGYSPFDFRTLNTLDILREIHQRLRYRVSLDALGKATLDAAQERRRVGRAAVVQRGAAGFDCRVLPKGRGADPRPVLLRAARKLFALRPPQRGKDAHPARLAARRIGRPQMIFSPYLTMVLGGCKLWPLR